MKTIFELLIISGATFNFIVLLILFKSMVKRPHLLLLAIFFAQLVFLQLDIYFSINSVELLVAHTNLLSDLVGFTLGPTFFFFVKGALQSKTKISRKFLFHLIPGLSFMVFVFLPTYFKDGLSTDYHVFLSYNRSDNWIFTIATNLYTMCYFIAGTGLLARPMPLYENHKLNANDIKWIYLVIACVNFVLLLDTYFAIIVQLFDFDPTYPFFITYSVFSILSYVTTWFALSKTTSIIPVQFIFKNKHRLVDVVQFNNVNGLKDKLHQIMIEQKPYLDENLGLYHLASMIGLSEKNLSVLLNHHMKISFYDFVNGYRIEEVKKQLANPEKSVYTIMGIAHDCGFKSKSSFNRIFKRLTQTSPNDYRRTQLNQDNHENVEIV